MKTTSNPLATALIVVLAVLAVGAWRPQTAAVTPARAEEAVCNASRSVQVSGAAVVYVVPDRALIQLGVQSNGRTPEGVQRDNQQAIQKVINAVKALGVDAKDIATDYYLVYPLYDDYSSLVITGYRIDNTVSITLRDVNLADDVLITALKAGANEVQDIQFYTSELRKYRDQARELAVKAAGEKAQALAQAAGAQTGYVLNVSENIWTQYYGSWRGGRQMALWAQNTYQNATPAQDDPTLSEDSPITLGQIAIRAEVNASYSLE
ncbi:MAG: SIMPL domain-containing protein [Anaerolineales bacterium]|nr:SIMPL domain-containing protein [Anaerolineales bacterium]